ncbi:hypothetical protein K491DRAFT_692898 [Lophiostoma macrostomum CBS 122681]|uniref:Uncharacterized protein n=1 Tax=Lophiostoma macrostomum CBS 122681 TaxID=1314788 RepID=A0A6A6T6Y4_9PLEO|nr:hypothetical protein K491DRAFT_692898 [Lophiostoma macrostomum CBS 122681]
MASAEGLLHAHEKAQANLQVKMSTVPVHTILRKKHPTIIDIYEGNENLMTHGVPQHLSYSFLFSNFNALATMGFSADAPTDNLDLVKAIWYWGMDKEHSLNLRWKPVRLNVILATFILANVENGQAVSEWVSDDALPFVTQFFQAWCATLHKGAPTDGFSVQERFLDTWIHGEYDLTHFSNRGLRRLQGFVDKLLVADHGINKSSTDLETALSKMSPGQLSQHGVALAVQYCYAFEKEHAHGHEIGAENMVVDTDLSLDDLARVDWGCPLVSSLLTDVDSSIPAPVDIPRPVKRRAPWISTDAAVDIFERKLNVDDVQKMFEGIAI